MNAAVIAQFKTKYETLSGIAHVAQNALEVAEVVMSILQASEGKRVALGEMPEAVTEAVESACQAAGIEVLKPPFDNTLLPKSIDDAEVGVSWAAFAVAETGSLVEFATNDATRLVSTLPDTHVGIVLASELVETLKEAASPIRAFLEANPESANVTFISGPSRTADIEMKLTLGVHGPEVAHAVILQD
ncbi:MAG: LUD domain-containing protein [bacterium]|nr:LUD domain-containing protein [bacterium]